MTDFWNVGKLKMQDRRHAVLFLDDDPDALSALRRALKSEPYDVYTTVDPGEALEWIRTRPVDVVVADQYMPSIAGTDFLRRVAETAPSAVRVVLTGHPDWLPFSEGLEGRVHWLLTKPWNPRELRETIGELIAVGSGARVL